MSSELKTTSKKNDGKPALTPKLRFPEFRDEDTWDKRLLGDVAPLQRGFDLPSDLIRPGKIPIVYSNGIQKYHDVGMAIGPGLVTGRSGTIGKLHFIEAGPYWPHNTSLWVTDFMGNAPRFVFYLYDSIGMSRFSSGSGVPTLNRNDVHAFLSSVPRSTPEQQKIADCLTSVDDLIAAQAGYVDALKTHKKGLMQQLFPREGETQPRLRLPEFRDAGEWEEKRLGDVASFFKGKGISKADISATGRHPCIRYGELYTRYGEVIDDIFSRTDVADADLFFSQSNDVIIPASGETKLDIAKASCVMRGNVALGGDLNVIRTDHNGVFLSYYLNGPKRLDIAKVAQGHTVVHLYPSQLEKLIVFIPEESEQQRIADCLTFLDDLITSQTQKLAALKTHKKGLMQQLFPVLEEVEA
jgi:type I restriction enzyme, S subunit